MSSPQPLCVLTQPLCVLTQPLCVLTQPLCVLTQPLCVLTQPLCVLTQPLCVLTQPLCVLTQPLCVLTQPLCVLAVHNMLFVSSELETIILQAMGYSLVMGTALHEEAWPKETPPIIKSIVKYMVRCIFSSNTCVVQECLHV